MVITYVVFLSLFCLFFPALIIGVLCIQRKKRIEKLKEIANSTGFEYDDPCELTESRLLQHVLRVRDGHADGITSEQKKNCLVGAELIVNQMHEDEY